MIDPESGPAKDLSKTDVDYISLEPAEDIPKK
jgi:hypothetical protein